VGLVLPQLQKQKHENFMNEQDTAVALASKELMVYFISLMMAL